MASAPIEITIPVDRNEAASMTHGAREKWLGEMAEVKLAETIPPRPSRSGSKRNRWKPYTRDGIAQAFAEWAQLNDGKTPSKRDWSHECDPEGRWPRPAAIASGRRLSSAPERTKSVFPGERRT